MIKLKGNLKPRHKKQLGEPNPKYDTRDIPLRITSDLITDMIEISDCYMGIQHRAGKLIADKVTVQSFVNDGVGAWYGAVDIGTFHALHDLDYQYTRSNHSDCWHWQTDKDKSHVRIRRAILELSGKNSQDKGKFIASETAINDHFKLFENGFIIVDNGQFKSKIPAVNLNNCRNSEFGSPACPLDGRLLNHTAFRVMGRKRGSPRSINNVIHIYDDMNLQFDQSAKKSFIVRVYKRAWSRQERLDNWDVYRAGKLIL